MAKVFVSTNISCICFIFSIYIYIYTHTYRIRICAYLYIHIHSFLNSPIPPNGCTLPSFHRFHRFHHIPPLPFVTANKLNALTSNPVHWNTVSTVLTISPIRFLFARNFVARTLMVSRGGEKKTN